MKNRQNDITAESLKSYPGFESMTDQEAEKAAKDIRTLARAVFDQMVRTKAFNPPSKAA